MPYNKEELLNLPVDEKLELVEALWESIDDNSSPVTKDEVIFAKERFNLHKQTPNEGLSWNDLKTKIKDRYGF